MHLIFIHSDYNHELLVDNVRFTIKFQRFNDSIIEKIKHAAVYSYCNTYNI